MQTAPAVGGSRLDGRDDLPGSHGSAFVDQWADRFVGRTQWRVTRTGESDGEDAPAGDRSGEGNRAGRRGSHGRAGRSDQVHAAVSRAVGGRGRLPSPDHQGAGCTDRPAPFLGVRLLFRLRARARGRVRPRARGRVRRRVPAPEASGGALTADGRFCRCSVRRGFLRERRRSTGTRRTDPDVQGPAFAGRGCCAGA